MASEQDSSSTDMLFADSRNGFIFTHETCPTGCSDGVIATHDGGRSWRHVRLPPLAQMVVGGTQVYALTAADTPVLWHSPIATDTWSELPQPSREAPASLATSGSTLLYLRRGAPDLATATTDPGALWQSTDGGRDWTARTMPCRPATDGAASVVAIALNHPNAWLVDCYDDRQSQQAQDTIHHLYRTADDGRTWLRLSDPTHHGDPDLLADNGAGHALLATSLLPASTLDVTIDKGATWRPVVTAGDYGQGHFSDLVLTSADIGYIAAPRAAGLTRALLRTTDGGEHWNAMHVALPAR